MRGCARAHDPVVPGEGIEPPCPRRAPGFKPGASDQFRHPGATRRTAYLLPARVHRLGRDPLRSLELERTTELRERGVVEPRALGEVRPGDLGDLVAERRER